ncbi:hypothetical protein [Pedobacter gandavensis]|nr:hypothetical protein [Pedobacter gandavensis]
MGNVKLVIKKQIVFKPAKQIAGAKSNKNASTTTLFTTTEIIGA